MIPDVWTVVNVILHSLSLTAGFDLKLQFRPLQGAVVCVLSSFSPWAIWYVSLSIKWYFFFLSNLWLVREKTRSIPSFSGEMQEPWLSSEVVILSSISEEYKSRVLDHILTIVEVGDFLLGESEMLPRQIWDREFFEVVNRTLLSPRRGTFFGGGNFIQSMLWGFEWKWKCLAYWRWSQQSKSKGMNAECMYVCGRSRPSVWRVDEAEGMLWLWRVEAWAEWWLIHK